MLNIYTHLESTPLLYNTNPATYVVFITLGTYLLSRVTKIRIWISNYIHSFIWDVLIHRRFDFNGDLS